MATIETKTKTTITISKKDRQALYNEQHGLCAYCERPLTADKRNSQYESRTEALICSQCRLIINGQRKAMEHFGSLDKVIEAMAAWERDYVNNPHCWLNGVRIRMNDDQPQRPQPDQTAGPDEEGQ